MYSMSRAAFHKLTPGGTIESDWYPGQIPTNIEVGENSVIDSSFCFKEFSSHLEIGLRVGKHVTFWRASLATEEAAIIEIGDACYIANASLVAAKQITIGDRVFIGGGATIADSDFHPLDPAARLADTIALSPIGNRARRPPLIAKPVIIGNDVWIGVNATILKGVHVGDGAVIAPGAVVLDDVAPRVTVSGNPARVEEGQQK